MSIIKLTQLLKEISSGSGSRDDVDLKPLDAKDQHLSKIRSDEPEPFGYGRPGLDESNSGGMDLPPGFSRTTVEDLPQSKGELDEADMLGAQTTDASEEDMKAYLQRTADRKKTPTDKFKYPYVHRSNIVDENGQLIDAEKLKAQIKQRPAQILKRNKKLQKSGGVDYAFYNVGLPALKGLVVDEKTNTFKIINTCPGAGACKVYCYAKRGGYVQFKAASMSQTRLLNFLVNDWEGFKNKMISELKSEESKYTKKNIKLLVRWHDAGDFFSPDYLKVAYDIADALPNIIFYAYTKMAGVATGDKPKNFVLNFSQGATPEQEKQVDVTKTKHSVVIPKQMFDDLTHKVGEENEKTLEFNSPQDLETFKNKVAAKYNIEKDSIITYDDLMKIPYDADTAEQKYNVLVWPGHGDDAAMRKDVLGTYLLWH